jgi:hypothetical protein
MSQSTYTPAMPTFWSTFEVTLELPEPEPCMIANVVDELAAATLEDEPEPTIDDVVLARITSTHEVEPPVIRNAWHGHSYPQGFVQVEASSRVARNVHGLHLDRLHTYFRDRGYTDRNDHYGLKLYPVAEVRKAIARLVEAGAVEVIQRKGEPVVVLTNADEYLDIPAELTCPEVERNEHTRDLMALSSN